MSKRLSLCLFAFILMQSQQNLFPQVDGESETRDRSSYLYSVNSQSNDVSTYEIQRVAFRTPGTVIAGAGPSAGTVNPEGTFFFVANSVSDTVSVFRIEGENLVPVEEAPAGDEPSSVVAAPNGDFVYVANALSDDIVIFSLNRSNGALTRLGKVVTGEAPAAMAISADGRFLLTANRLSDDLSVFARDAASGALSELSCADGCSADGRFATGEGPRSLALTRDGLVFVANASSGDLSFFSLNDETQVLTEIPCRTNCNPHGRVAVQSPRSLALSSSERFLYVANGSAAGDDGGVTVLEISKTAPSIAETGRTEVAGSPESIVLSPSDPFLIIASINRLSVGVNRDILSVHKINPANGRVETEPTATENTDLVGELALSPDGRLIFGLNLFTTVGLAGRVAIFRLDENGNLSRAQVRTGNAPADAAISRRGDFLFVANSGSDSLSIFGLDEETATLTDPTTVPVGKTPVSLAVSSEQDCLFVVNSGSDDVSVLEQDEASGQWMETQRIATGLTPTSAAASPGESLVFVTNFSSGDLSVLALDGAGQWTETRRVMVGPQPISVAVAQQGGIVLVATQEPSEIVVFRLSDNGGELTELTRVGVLSTPRRIAVSPEGDFVFAALGGSNVISVLELNSATGALRSLRLVPTGQLPVSVSVTPDGRFVLVANFGGLEGNLLLPGASGDVAVFGFDNETGRLTELDRLTVGTSPAAAVVTPRGDSVFVANFVSNDLSLIQIDDSGANLRANRRASPTGLFPVSAALSPDGKFLFVANFSSNDLTVSAVDENSGAVTFLTTFSGLSAPRSVAVSPDGDHVFVANSGSDDVSVLAFDRDRGELAHLDRQTVGTLPISLAVSGEFVYVVNLFSEDLTVLRFNKDGGTLQETQVVPDVPLPFSVTAARPFVVVASFEAVAVEGIGSVGIGTVFRMDDSTGMLTRVGSGITGPSTVSAAVSGGFAFFCNQFSHTVTVLRLDSSGSLEFGRPFGTGLLPIFVAPAPEQGLVFVANAGSNDVSAFRLDERTGDLTELARVPVGDLPAALAVSPAGLLVVANANSDNVTLLRLDEEIGLTANPRTARGPQAMAFHPSGRFAYVANLLDDSISVHQVDPDDGSLDPFLDVPAVDSPDGPTAIAVDGEGRHLYSANANSDSLAVYQIQNEGASLNLIQEVSAGRSPYDLEIRQDGRFVYAANFGDDSISVFERDVQSGLLTPLDRTDTPSGPLSLTIDENGEFLFSANFSDELDGRGSISQFEILSDGRLTEVQTFAAGRAPSSLATVSRQLERDGEQFLYAVNSGSNDISSFRIRGRQPAEPLGTSLPTGDGPVAIVRDPSGDFVYVANNAANMVSVYRVNRDTGQLTFQQAAPAGMAPQALAVAPR